jgi:hypothetical protein
MAFQVHTAGALLELGPDGLMLTDVEGKRCAIRSPNSDPYAEELSYFQQRCDAGETANRCPPEESAAAVKLALLVKRSVDLDGEEIPCAL